MKKIDHEYRVGSYKKSHNASSIVFDNAQWILTTGAVYYVTNKYSKLLAEALSMSLSYCIIMPLLYHVLSYITDLMGITEKKSGFITIMLLSLVPSWFVSNYVIKIVQFIATNQNGS